MTIANTLSFIQDSTGALTTGTFNANGYPMTFSVLGAEEMRIDPSGYLLINYNTSQGTYHLQVNGNVLFNGDVVATGTINSTSDQITADRIRTVAVGTNATYYLTFVDTNNGTSDYEQLYTDAGITYNPSTDNLAISGDLTVSGGQITMDAVSSRDKIRVWSSTPYSIGMQSGITFGAVNNEYAMTFQMNNSNSRGFWWGDDGHTTAQGSMALSTDGKLTVAHSIRIGYGEADATIPGATHRLDVSGNAYITGSLGVGTVAASTSTSAGEIRASNEITAYYTSDADLKENIRLIEDPISKLNSIRGVYFDWIDEHIQKRGGEDGYFVRKHDVGVIAQDVEPVLPEVVATRDDGTLAVRYEKMVPLLIEAIKKQQEIINQISERLDLLVVK